MTRRMTSLLALGVLLAGSLAVRAEVPRLVQRTYPVADLIIPLDNYGPSSPSAFSTTPARAPAAPTTQDQLMRLIFNSVAPESWAEVGGRATMDYFPLGMALVINQTVAVHEQIAALLDSLRQNLDKEVTVEVRAVSVGEKMARHLRQEYGIDCTRCQKADDTTEAPQVTILKDDVELFKLMECFQGDRQTNVMQAPKLTLFNGQYANCQIKDYQWFVTNVEVVEHAGQVVFVPQNQPVGLGWDMGVQPVIGGDGKSVRVRVTVNYTNLASAAVPLFPVTKFITPVVEGGAQGQPIPFTQFVQQPTVSTWKLDQALNIPITGTALLSGWQMDVEMPWDGPAVLEHIPFVNDLCRKLLTRREKQYMLLLVTPRVMEPQTAQEAALRAVAPQPFAAAPSGPGGYSLVEAPPAPLPQVSAAPAYVPTVAPAPAAAMAPGAWTRTYVPAPAGCAPLPAPLPEMAVMPVSFQAPVAEPTESDFLKGVKREVADLLVQKYHQACRQGRTADAKTLAEQALFLDPACFSVAPARR